MSGKYVQFCFLLIAEKWKCEDKKDKTFNKQLDSLVPASWRNRDSVKIRFHN